MSTQPELLNQTAGADTNSAGITIGVKAREDSIQVLTTGGDQLSADQREAKWQLSPESDSLMADKSNDNSTEQSSSDGQQLSPSGATAVRHESVIRSTGASLQTSQTGPQPSTPCYLSANSAPHVFNQNPFSKTTAINSGQQSSVTTTCVSAGATPAGGGSAGLSAMPVPAVTVSSAAPPVADQADTRSSVILAPARLALNTSSNSSNNTSNNYFSNNFNNINNNCSAILAESRLSSSSFTSNTSNKSLLRPSVLRVADSSTNNSQNAQKEGKVFTFVSLSKEDISRPATTLYTQTDSIIRCGADTTSPFNGEEAPAGQTSSTSGAGASASTAVTSTSSVTFSDVLSSVSAGCGVSGGAGSDGDDSNSESGFVFGQNLAERAVFVRKSKQKNNENHENSAENCKKLRAEEKDSADTNTGEYNGQSAAASTSSATPNADSAPIKPNSDGVLDLSSTGSAESSPEKDNKRKYEVITGEEDEQNVLSMHCRLYAWETDTSSWKERGRGCLRLNDVIKDEKLCSRIVMRTSGALRVILNAHLLSGMRFDMSNEYCLRFTNVDGIYLIKGAPKDIDQLNSAIDYRLREISKRHKSSDSSSESSPKTTEQQTMEDMSNDSWNQAISTKE